MTFQQYSTVVLFKQLILLKKIPNTIVILLKQGKMSVTNLHYRKCSKSRNRSIESAYAIFNQFIQNMPMK